MENSNGTKEKVGREQRFYFNEDGKLVVESNKGVWVDGQQFVKMYGYFQCNAKTMGAIIHALRGIPVETGLEEKIVICKDKVAKEILGIQDEHTIKYYCVLRASDERVKEYEKTLAEQDFADDYITSLKSAICEYNKLPWWKRMFKKVEI